MTGAINTQLLLTFIITVAVIVAVPGPSVMFIVSRAITAGRPAGLAAAAGNTAGLTVQGILAALGLGTLISRVPVLYTVIQIVGALYLLVMGARMLCNRELVTTGGAEETGDVRRNAARQGFVVGMTNPKIIVFFAAVLPQFIDRSRGYIVVQMLVLLASFSVLSLCSDSTWGIAGSSLRKWNESSPARIERLIGAGGLCIMVAGAALLFTHRVG